MRALRAHWDTPSEAAGRLVELLQDEDAGRMKPIEFEITQGPKGPQAENVRAL